MRPAVRAHALAALAVVALSAACGPRRIELPAGAGTPFPDASAAYEAAVGECRSARTLQASLGLSGRAADTTLRGTVDAGFEAPDRVRLEGRHPFGRPAFVLVGSASDATLHLPRDSRVLRGAPTDAIVEALVGLRLGGAELRALVSGCGFGAVTDPVNGRGYGKGYVAVDGGGSTTYLRQMDGRWRVVAATRAPLTVFYSAFASGRPATVRLRSEGPTRADVAVTLSDVAINMPFGPAVFQVAVPAEAEPLTLDELRRAGPLGDR